MYDYFLLPFHSLPLLRVVAVPHADATWGANSRSNGAELLEGKQHDLTRPGPQNRGLVRAIPLFQGNLGWWNMIIWPDNLIQQKELPHSFQKDDWKASVFFGIILASELKSFQCLNNCPVSADLTPRPLPLRIAILLFGPGPLHVPDAGYQMALLQSVCLMCHDMKLSYFVGRHQNHPTNVEAEYEATWWGNLYFQWCHNLVFWRLDENGILPNHRTCPVFFDF